MNDDPLKTGQAQKLYHKIAAKFSKEGLKTLCFQVGVDYDNLPGDGKQAKARELVVHLVRLGQLATLESAVAQQLAAPQSTATAGSDDQASDSSTIIKGNNNIVVGKRGVYVAGDVGGNIVTGDGQ